MNQCKPDIAEELMHEHDDAFDRGLIHDLQVLNAFSNRRRVLRWLASASLLPIVGCGSENAGSGDTVGASGASGAGTVSSSAGTSAGGASANTAGANAAGTASNNTAGSASSGDTTCSKIPEETGGPYPGDGTNGPNALTTSGIVRDDITTSFAGLTGAADGVPLSVTLKIVDANGCAVKAGYAVYIWHCDRNGNYSMYTAADQNYLRGVQETDADGNVTFKTIFPGCYSGRWPHIHFEVFSSLEAATEATGKVATPQLALPQAPCAEVYATTGYETSVANLSKITLATDNVFSDGASKETPTVTGNVNAGYAATLTVGV
jgi:protocatechuate 3,4-dioxygenase beta subunit